MFLFHCLTIYTYNMCLAIAGKRIVYHYLNYFLERPFPSYGYCRFKNTNKSRNYDIKLRIILFDSIKLLLSSTRVCLYCGEKSMT